MKTMNYLRFPLAILILILPVLVATPAYANAPVHEVFEVAFDDFFPAEANPCGFDLYLHWAGQINLITWYDDAGNPVRSLEAYGQFRGEWDGGGNTLTALGQGLVRISYLSNTERLLTITGVSALTPVPGYGIAAGIVGNQTIRQVLENGTWQDVEVSELNGRDPWSDEARDAACGYLAPS